MSDNDPDDFIKKLMAGDSKNFKLDLDDDSLRKETEKRLARIADPMHVIEACVCGLKDKAQPIEVFEALIAAAALICVQAMRRNNKDITEDSVFDNTLSRIIPLAGVYAGYFTDITSKESKAQMN